MKRILITLTLLCVAVFAYAQKGIPAGQRFESVEIEDNDYSYSVFKYKDADGTLGYYLSLGNTAIEAEFSIRDLTSSIKHVDETCLCLGANVEEAYAALDDLLELVGEDPGTVKEFESRKTNGVGLLDYGTIPCMVVKPFLGGKRLRFTFVTASGRSVDVDLTKGSIKSLRRGLKINQTFQPD